MIKQGLKEIVQKKKDFLFKFTLKEAINSEFDQEIEKNT